MVFRYIVIVHPMRSRALCTSSNCRRALLLVWGLSLLLALPVVYTNVSEMYKCQCQLVTWSGYCIFLQKLRENSIRKRLNHKFIVILHRGDTYKKQDRETSSVEELKFISENWILQCTNSGKLDIRQKSDRQFNSHWEGQTTSGTAAKIVNKKKQALTVQFHIKIFLRARF